ncbi:MAG: hypothetical protein ACLUEV_12175, partial [Alistipes sp.]
FFDCTNASLTWKSSYDVLIDVWTKAQGDGVNVPKIAFMLPFGPVDWSLVSLRQLYEDIYKPGRAENLWFYLHGKPCIMAYPDNLTDSPEDRAIRDFFTFRPGQPDYVDGPFPRARPVGLKSIRSISLSNVRTAAAKRWWSAWRKMRTMPAAALLCFQCAGNLRAQLYPTARAGYPRGCYLYGLNIQEQWDYALQCDPDLIFVTGWNEFIAGKHIGWHPAAPIIRLHSPISSTGNAAAISNRSRRGR